MILINAAVFVVDDDPLIRDALAQLIKSVGLEVHTFESAEAFLNKNLPDKPSCLILDVRMPLVGGLDLQDELSKRGISIPIIFITGHGTVPLSVRAMKAGALDFLQKPFEDQELLDAIHRAIQIDIQSRQEQAERNDIKQHMDALTPREREVMILVVAGKANKEIAHNLKISENTVKAHRARIMQKMKLQSLADLVRVADKMGISK